MVTTEAPNQRADEQADRVLIAAPAGGDVDVLCGALDEAHIECHRCGSLDELFDQIERGAAAAIIADELLTPDGQHRLTAALERQPEWSDFPIILMSGADENRAGTFPAPITENGHGYVVSLQRPVRKATLLSAVNSAIRSRARQYQVRDELLARKRAEHALRESQERFARFMQHLPGLAWIKDARGRYVYINDAAEKAFQKTREQIYGKTDADVFPPEVADRFTANDRRALFSGSGIQVVETLTHDDGVEHHSIVSKFIIPGSEDADTLIGGMAIDITERKQAEETLRIRARQQHAVATLGELALRERNVQRVFDYATATLAETLEVEYANVLEILPEGDRVLLRAGVGWHEGLVGNATVSTSIDSQAGYTLLSDGPVVVRDLRSESRFSGPPLLHEHQVVSGMSCIIRHADGTPWGVLGAHAIRRVDFDRNDISFMLAVANILGDAIDRDRAEIALRAEEERFRRVVVGLPAAVFATDAKGRVTLFNDAAADLFGRRPTLGDDSWRGACRTFHPDGSPMPLDECPMSVSLRERRAVRESLVFERHDGSRRHVLANSEPMFDARGRLTGAINMLIDLTERERAERARAYLAAIVENTQDAVVSKTLDGIITSWNAAAERIFGHTAEEAVGQPITIIIPPDRLDEERSILQRLRRGERIDHFETERVTRDGRRIDISLTVSPVRDTSGRIVGASKVARDISDRKRSEAALKAREAELELIAKTTPLILTRCSRDLRYRFANRAAADLFGIAPEEMIGRPIKDVLGSEAFELIEPFIERVLRGESVEFEREIPYPAVGMRWMRVNYVPDYNDQDELTGWIASIVDITDRKRAEEAVRASEQRFRTLAEAVPAFVWACRPDGFVFYVNRRWTEFTGETLEEAQGHGWSQTLHPDDRQCVVDLWNHCTRTGDVYEGECRYRRHDGQYRWHYFRGIPSRTRLGAIDAWYGTSFDIQEKKIAEEALRESEAKFRQLAETMPQLAWYADADGYITWYNQRWFEYTGTTPLQMEGWGWQSVHDPDVLPEVLEKWRRSIQTGEPFYMVFPLRGADDVFRPFLTRIVPLKDRHGRVVQWFGTNTDISEQQKMQEALRDADRRKDEFLATLAHELRNPLAPIRNAVRIMNVRGLQDPALQSARDMIDRQVQHMVRLIDDLLDLSRITRGTLELRKTQVSLTDVIEQALETSRPHAATAGHELTVDLPDEPIYLSADPVRLAQVFSNLLTNACKYTEPPGRIRLTAAREGDDAVVTVQDNGLGIPPDRLEEIFEMFSQLDATLARSPDGLGIGLWLVRRLVDMHGGSIAVMSDGPDKGSMFTVRLPIRIGAKPSPARQRPRSQRSAPTLRILVVDDNRDAAESLAMLLTYAGHEVGTVYDGTAALESAAANPPQAVLLDIGLPKLNGYEVARRLREQPGGGDMLIVAMTGWGQADDKNRSLEAGCDAHLTKPPDLDELMKLLADAGNRNTEPA